MKKISKVILLSVLSLLLCSFTSASPLDSYGTNNRDEKQEEFDEEVALLDPDLDEDAVLGKEHEIVDNQLTDEEIGQIGEYVFYDEKHIALDDAIYKAMPVNDECISPEKYEEEHGEPCPLDFEEYKKNYRKLSFVSDNRNTINELVEQEYGLIDSTGSFEFFSNDYVQQFYVMNLRISWIRTTFTADDSVTIVLGFIGCLFHLGTIKDIRKLFNKDKTDAYSDLAAVADDALGEIPTFFSQEILDHLEDFADLLYSVFQIFQSTSFFGRLLTLLKYIIGHYLPGLLKGVIRLLGGGLYHYGSNDEIGIWWSNYSLTNYPLV